MSNDDFPLIPPWEDLDFAANCTAWGNWLATWLLPNPWSRLESLSGGFSTTMVLIEESFPPDSLIGGNMSTPRLASTVTEWWTYQMYDSYEYDEAGNPVDLNLDSDFILNVMFPGIEKCPNEVCKAQAYTGNADITGIGIYIAYFMQATLSTLYLVAFTVSHIRKHTKTGAGARKSVRRSILGKKDESTSDAPAPRLTLGRRTLDAFRGSLDGFLVSAMLMCIAMISAALYLAVQGYKNNAIPFMNQDLPFGDSSTYNQVLSVIAAGFSTFPVLVLYALLSRRDRGDENTTSNRVWLRRAALFAIWVLLTVEVYLSPRGNSDYGERHDKDQEANWDPCNKRGGTRYWNTMKAAQVLVIGLPLLWLVISVFFNAGFGIRGLADRPWVRKVAERPWLIRSRPAWELGIAWFNLLAAWALLVYFSILRGEIVETAGGADKANEWGFGQILTLGTWVPVMLEWLYIFIWGIEDSLNTRIPRGFEVRPRPNEPHHNDTVGLGPHEQYDVTLPFIESAGSTENAPVRKDTAG